jgi:O-antigen ligase
MLLAITLALAVLLFGRRTRRQQAILVAVLGLLGLALLLAETRSAWLGAGCAVAVLLFLWRPWAVAVLPVLGVLVYGLSPAPVRERVNSIVQPHGETDSNQHRTVTRAVGYRMIAAHPWLGLGPEGPGKHFREYLPEEYRTRPLPDGYYGHLHNVYLQYAAERGLPALGCLLLFVGWNLRAWRRERRVLTYFALAAVVGLAANGLFEHNLGDSEVLTLFLALFGLGGKARPETV